MTGTLEQDLGLDSVFVRLSAREAKAATGFTPTHTRVIHSRFG